MSALMVTKPSKPAWQYGSSGILYSRWSFKKHSDTDHYDVLWQFKVGDGELFQESTSQTKEKVSTFTPPDNAAMVRIGVKPIAKKTKKVSVKKKSGKYTDVFRSTKQKDRYKSGGYNYSDWLKLSDIYEQPKVSPVPGNNIVFRIESGTENTILVDWSSYNPGSKMFGQIASYTVQWSYSPEDNPTESQWRQATDINDITVKNCTISTSSNYKYIRVRIAPVSKTQEKYGNAVGYWVCDFGGDNNAWKKYKISDGTSSLVPGKNPVDYKSIQIKPQQGNGCTAYATWSWDMSSGSNTDHFNVKWEFCTTNNASTAVWFPGVEDSPTTTLSTYSVPDNATYIRVSVQPVAEETTGGYPYWEAPWAGPVSASVYMFPPEKPPTPTVTIVGTKIRAEIRNYSDFSAKSIAFAFYKRKSAMGAVALVTKPVIDLRLGEAITEIDGTVGYGYEVRCCAYNGVLYSDWSDFSDTVYMPPEAPKGFKVLRAESESSVLAQWDAVDTAEEYEIEYTPKKEYFDNTDVEKVTGITTTSRIITDISGGSVYWFRLRAKRSDLYSGWCEPKSVAVGTKPDPPTTWTLVTNFIVGSQITFYWTHNSQDGSEQTAAKIQLTINGVVQTAISISGNTNEYTYDSSSLTDGATILWKVQTKGVINEYSDWSVQRKVMIHAAATLDMADYDNPSVFWQDLTPEEEEAYADYIGTNVGLPDTFTVFPLFVAAVAGPSNQNAIRYLISIITNESYETVDFDGESQYVNEGDEIYTEAIDAIGHHLLRVLTPADINLDNGISYTVSVSVSMDTGLTAEATKEFTVSWEDAGLDPSAILEYDTDDLVCYITPYCDADIDDIVLDNNGNSVLDNTGEEVHSTEYIEHIDDAYVSVYRREYDGTFIEIAKNLDSAEFVTVVDPHPALDYARYRITAVHKDSGEIYYTDLPGEPCGETSVIIQWDEAWVPFTEEGYEEYEEVNPPYSGSTLMLPYDIDVSTNYQPDVIMAEYIGRKHPVSYYGTQKGETATWNVDVWFDDAETLYGLRRLANYPGDVYVREPSGSGYWAHVTVSFSQKHNDLVVPVTLSITRVEGGM